MGQPFKVLYQKSKEAKLKVVVSKKVAKRAVDRNRIKRITKEALRGKTNEGLKIIVRNNIANLKTQEVEQRLKKFSINDSKNC